MISKEVRHRRLVNHLWHGLSSKARREQQLNKDGYRWLVRNFTLRGLNPRKLGQRPVANLAKTLYQRFGEFTPDNIANIHRVSKGLEPLWPYADPASDYELRLQDKGKDRTEEEEVEYMRLVQERHKERRRRPDENLHELLTDVAKTYGMVHEALPKELPPEVQAIDPHRQRQFKYEAAPPGRSAFYERLVDAGFINEGDEIPEDPPEGWEPPIEGMDDDAPLDPELFDAPQDPQEPIMPEDEDFMFGDDEPDQR